MVIFLDVFIIEQIIVNTFLLHITSQTLQVHIKSKRLLLTGSLSSLYSLTMIFPQFQLFTEIGFKLLFAMCMILFAFRNKNIIFIIKTLCIFIMYAMTLAGFCIFIEFYISKDIVIEDYMLPFSCKYIILSLMVIYIVIGRLIVFIKDRNEIKNLIYDVEIVNGDNKVLVKAFLDTGNELREPATNLPVILVEKNIISNIQYEKKLYIPFKLVDGSIGYLEGFKPSYANIHIKKDIKKLDLVVAISDTKLCDLNEYSALLPRGIL